MLTARMLGGLLAYAALGSHLGIAAENATAEIPANTWVDAEAEYILPESIPDAQWMTTDGYCGSTYRSKTGTILFRSGVRSKQKGLSPGFYSNAFGDADRLANGNTLFPDPVNGRILEVTPDHEIAWEMRLPPTYMIYKAERIAAPPAL